MSDFECAINYVLRNEATLSGEETSNIKRHGISLNFLKSLSRDKLTEYLIYEEPTAQTIYDLNLSQIRGIYFKQYWQQAPFDKIMNQEHCNYIFDMAVTMGIAPAIKCVQRATWAVMKKCALADDGILNDATLTALNQWCGFLIMPALRAERFHSWYGGDNLQDSMVRVYES